MINNREGQGELSLSLSFYLFRERIEPLSREIWGRESGETGTRIINDLERQVFGDNRLQLLENSHVLLTRDRSFLSFFLLEEDFVPRINTTRFPSVWKNILDELERDKPRKKRRP